MKFEKLEKLPNDGFYTAASLYGVIKNEILLGGGSGFTVPLAEGGAKHLSNSIRLIENSGKKWIIKDQIKVVNKNLDYKFCNGFSALIDNCIYYFGGLKIEGNGQIQESSDILKVWLNAGKIEYKIYENILPYKGEVTGTTYIDNKVFIICKNECFITKIIIDSDKDTFETNKIESKDFIVNGAIPCFVNGLIYIIGGYIPFSKDNPNSNNFLETQLIKFDGASFVREKIENIEKDPCVFLGGSALTVGNKVLIVGGVNKKCFQEAIHNLSTLKDNELAEYKKVYFNNSVEWFNFNKKLLSLDLDSKALHNIGEFDVGFAGNPSFIKIDSKYFILTSEIKAGVRLENPIKFEL
ncbi:MAG: hypothetical protein K2I76_02725 [Malacoplasma sp.]|nr:hypothetical protein [Malacoplasma sp.]